MFRKLFGSGKKQGQKVTELDEFEWMATQAIKKLKITAADIEKMTSLYNSDLKWCIIRHYIGEDKKFYLLDYENLKHYPLKSNFVQMDLEEFLIFQKGNLKVICRIEIAILDLIKKNC